MSEETCGHKFGSRWKQYVCALLLCVPLYICSYFLTRMSFFAEGFIASNTNSESDPKDDIQRMGTGVQDVLPLHLNSSIRDYSDLIALLQYYNYTLPFSSII